MTQTNDTRKPVKQSGKFVYTTAIKKLRKLTKRVRVIPGGSSAGKTFGIIPLLIDYAIKNPGTEISIVSVSFPHLRKGAIKDFKNIMRETLRWNRNQWKETIFTYTFANGSFIEFFSVDDEEKARGPRRNIVYVNECNLISFEIYRQLAIRTDDIIWLDFNPANPFWVHEELQDIPGAEWLTLTYKDNEALSQSIIDELELSLHKGFIDPDLPIELLFRDENIKSAYWANQWKVYGLGMLGTLENALFPEHDLNFYDELPDAKDLISILGFVDIADMGTDYHSFPVGYVYKTGDIYIEDVLFTQLPTSQNVNMTAKTIKDNKVNFCRVESNFGGSMYIQLLQPELKAIDPQTKTKLLPAKQTTNKHSRIIASEYKIKRYFYFKRSYKANSMYNQYMLNIFSYLTDGSQKNDDAPDSNEGLAQLAQSMYPQLYILKK